MSAPSDDGVNDRAAEQIFAAFNANRKPSVDSMMKTFSVGLAPTPGQFGQVREDNDADNR